MIARLVLGYLLAVVAFIPHVARTVGKGASCKLTILMTSQAAGTLQVYYDTGGGLREIDSIAVPLAPERREYELPLPSGNYRLLRIDPGNAGGRYTIERAVIRRPDGSTYWSIPLEELRPVNQLSLIERTSEHLVVDSPPGSNDPQLLYIPAAPFSLAVSPPGVWRLLACLLGYVVAAVLLIALLERALRRLAPAVSQRLQAAAQWSEAHPKSAVLVAAAVATLIAIYPILFLNRSLVSPNNGGTVMLYDDPPFLPGARDPDFENVRGSDVYATMLGFVPYAKTEREALSRGELPLWNRYNGAGRPLWGQGMSFLGDPLHWLTLLSPDWGHDLKFVAHRFLFAAGVGLAALAAMSSWPAASIAAIVAPFLGYFTFRFNHPGAFSLTYAPWILLGWLALAGARTRTQMARAAVLLALAAAFVLLASPPKEAVVMLAGCQAAGLLALCLGERGAPRAPSSLVWQRVGFAAAAGVVTLTITAPVWIVFLDTLSRSMTAYDRPAAAFFSIGAAPQLLLGSLSPFAQLPTLQIAAVPLLLAVVPGFRKLACRPMILACLVMAVCLIAMAFGAIPAEWLIRLPLVANIGHIGDTTTTVSIVLLSVVCAVGVESLLAASMAQACILTGCVGLTAVWLLRDAAGRSTDRSETWVIGLLLAGLMGVPLSVRALQRRRGRVLPVVSVLGLSALVLLPGGLQVHTGVAALDLMLPQPRRRVDFEARSPAVDAIRRTMTEPARAAGLGNVLKVGSQSLYDLEGIGGPDALTIPLYEELVDAAPIDRPGASASEGGWWIRVSTPSLDRVTPLLDMLNVEYVLAPMDSVVPGAVEIPTREPDRLRPWRRPTAWPRAFFVDGVQAVRDARDLLAQVAAHPKPFAAVQSTDRQAMMATRDARAPSGDVQPASRYTLTANTTGFLVRAPAPGVVVLTETFLPDDFRATLNGKPVDYFRVNHAFKAVVIPSAGEWTVKFEYRPRRWNLSLAIAAFGVLLLGGLCLLARDTVARPIYSAS